MLQLGVCSRALLACLFALSFSVTVNAETCNGGLDNAASFSWTQGPSGPLKPGVPQHVVVHVVNSSTSKTWSGEGTQPYPYRLGAAYTGIQNQLIWSNFSCGGLSNAGQVTNQRVYFCGAPVPPGAGHDFAFDITAPQGAAGSTIELGLQMLVEAGTSCDGWFGGAVHVPVALDATPVVTIPSTPSNLGANAGNGRVDLNWGTVSGAKDYNVFRSVGSNAGYTFLGTTAAGSYPDTSVSNGTIYYYFVTSHNDAGLSGRSNEVSATPSSGVTTPAAPTGLGANAGNGSVNLFWSGVSGASEYRLYRSDGSSCCFSNVATIQSPGTPFNDGGRTNGTTYYYVVRAYNSAGESGSSNQASATPTSGITVPTAPIGLGASAGDGRVELSWNAVGGATDYKVYRSSTSGCCYSYFVGGTGDTRLSDTAVSNGTTYYYVVQAHNSVGDSGYSGQAQATPSSVASAPNTPTGLNANGVVGRVDLTWTAVNGASEYYVFRSSYSGTGYSYQGLSYSPSYTDGNVTNGTEYFYVVKAHNSTGDSQPSNEARATPQAPVQLTPTVTIQIVRPDGTVMADGTSLGLNTDGWPTPDPLRVRVTLHCPADRAQGCSPILTMEFASPGDAARMYVMTNDTACSVSYSTGLDPHFNLMRMGCGGDALLADQSRVYSFRLMVQPSPKATINMTAVWDGFATDTSHIEVPLAQIHPVIVIPGILGTMPPWAHTGELDPVLAVYEPLMLQLNKMGYDGLTAFRMPYDWRRSNRISARYLRDRIKEAQGEAATIPWVDHSSTKVDLIVHSMGGLVTRSYVQGEGLEADMTTAIGYNSDIRKVVFMATPHQGFPEDYKTFESGSWWDFLYDTPAQSWAMDHVFWPAFVYKHWRESYPVSPPPIDCDWSVTIVTCVLNEYAMTHDASGGIESMREMLPTQRADTYYAPYLCDSYNGSNCVGPYQYGQPLNPFLTRLNANIGLLDARIGADNMYVIYGVNPNRNADGTENPTAHNDTDVVYDVKAPPAAGTYLGINGWRNGEPEQNYVTSAGDDLIPEYSSNLKFILPTIKDDHIAKLSGKAARHKEIMYNRDVQRTYLPQFLTGLSTLPFDSPYSLPTFLVEPYQWWVLAGLCPVNLTITDPQGRRIGYDPATGATLNEIPGMYAAKNSENQFIILKNPAAGSYTVTVTAFGDGPFSLGLHQLSQAGSPKRWAVEGEVKTGQSFSYTVNIDPTLPIVQHNPVANAGADQSVMADDTSCTAPVQLDGSASSDPDGEALNFHWTGPFGYVSGARPRVTLSVGNHEVRLVVFDGQRGGSGARTHVNVSAHAPEVKSLTVRPEILEQADNTMRDVMVIADVTTVCGVKPTCKILKVESDEDIKDDWKIVGPLQVKLRAERAGDENGRLYKLRMQCQTPNGKTINQTINVKVRPAGRIKGSGTVVHNERSYKFDFDVSESKAGKDAGTVKLDVRRMEFEKNDSKQDQTSKFRSTGTMSVTFRDDNDYQPGGSAKVDWVQVYGQGEWDGKAGYTFEMRAVDDGEPGHGRDRFHMIVRDAQGKIVVSVSEEIDSGNIQSSKPPK